MIQPSVVEPGFPPSDVFSVRVLVTLDSVKSGVKAMLIFLESFAASKNGSQSRTLNPNPSHGFSSMSNPVTHRGTWPVFLAVNGLFTVRLGNVCCLVMVLSQSFRCFSVTSKACMIDPARLFPNLISPVT